MRNLQNYDEFYEKGEPRTLSDWTLENPMNAVIQQLMIVAGIERVDQLMIPGHLHLKLRKGF